MPTTPTAVQSTALAASIWFIDNSVGGGPGDGTQNNPFRSIAEFNAANDGAPGHPGDGDIVYLRFGTGTYLEADGANLRDGQQLIGQGQDLVVNGSIIEHGDPSLTATIKVNGGTNDGIDLARNNTVSGLNVDTELGTGVGIDNDGHDVGRLSMSDISVSTSTGSGILLDHGGTVTVPALATPLPRPAARRSTSPTRPSARPTSPSKASRRSAAAPRASSSTPRARSAG
jgi:hypothetical protein